MPARRLQIRPVKVPVATPSKGDQEACRQVVRGGTRRHDSGVKSLRPFLEQARNELKRVSADCNSALSRLDEPALDEIAEICSRVLNTLATRPVAFTKIVDPRSGLVLPPPPPIIFYRDRKSVPNMRTMTPEQFIEATDWDKYRRAGLLAVDFIRRSDPSLYDALGGRATYQGRSIASLLDEIGVLSRTAIFNPRRDQAEAAGLIRAALAQLKAKKTQEKVMRTILEL